MDNGSLFTDGSRLMMESLAQAGADAFVGYPITPANLLYLYASQRFTHFTAAPDEITTLQLMSGYAAAGRIPVTATSFPGYALMLEGINMAYMMELPMVIILVQRLGPATGTATLGAQGDLALINGTISGGMALPTFGISQPSDCWDIPPIAVETAVKLRTPVVILTSKEEVMTQFSLDPNTLPAIKPLERSFYDSDQPYRPYAPGPDSVPPFLPVTTDRHQVRLTASTHDQRGIIQNASPEALANSTRLHTKIVDHISEFTHYELIEHPGAQTLIITYGITSQAAREVSLSRGEPQPAAPKADSSANPPAANPPASPSLLILKTLLPCPPVIFNIIAKYRHIIIAEENLTGQYKQLLFGNNPPPHVTGINQFGKMITPETIEQEVMKHE